MKVGFMQQTLSPMCVSNDGFGLEKFWFGGQHVFLSQGSSDTRVGLVKTGEFGLEKFVILLIYFSFIYVLFYLET